MRWIVLLCVIAGAEAGNRPSQDLKLIDELDTFVQARFRTAQTLPSASDPMLGMSRTAQPTSFGKHYLPGFAVTRDFKPETPEETEIITKLESAPLQVGFYLFGRALLKSQSSGRDFRALKGPAALTAGTPRPTWYPTGLNPNPAPDALPDWNAIYPLAQKAMKSFADGGAGFDTEMGTWHIAARPVLATQQRCLTCHVGILGINGTLALHQALGGIIYAYRNAGA